MTSPTDPSFEGEWEMGAFYGSAQIRTDDRDALRAALSRSSRQKARYLIGPPIRGWVGVYPDHSGQDFGYARTLAKRLPTLEMIAFLVHDDDIFAYEYYRDGKRVDQYNSIPDYFGEVSKKVRRDLRGKPSTFAHLAVDPTRFPALEARLLDQADDRAVFASGLLEEFANVLGIANALTSYEYLQEEDDDQTESETEGRDQFLHVPDLGPEQIRKRAAEAVMLKRKQALIAEGKLLAEILGVKGSSSPHPWLCPSPDGSGFLVVWENSFHADLTGPPLAIERQGPPWSSSPSPTPWSIGHRVHGIELSPSGRYLAVAHAAGDWKATLWDLSENRLVADVPQIRAVSSIGFTPDESAMFSVSFEGDDGQVVLTPVVGGDSTVIPITQAKLAAIHPDGKWLVVADHLSRLIVVDRGSGTIERTRFVGGRFVPTDMERQILANVHARMSPDQYDAWEKALRKHQGKYLTKPSGASPEQVEQVERLRRQFEEQIATFRNRFETSGSPFGPIPVKPDRGIEGVYRIGFDPTGDRLFLATSAGVRVYAWPEVLDEDGDLVRLSLAVDLAQGPLEAEGGFVYDRERDRLIFGGLDGRIRFLDLGTGRSGVLLEPLVPETILRLRLSGDRETLAVTSHPVIERRESCSPTLRFWNYRSIGSASIPAL